MIGCTRCGSHRCGYQIPLRRAKGQRHATTLAPARTGTHPPTRGRCSVGLALPSTSVARDCSLDFFLWRPQRALRIAATTSGNGGGGRDSLALPFLLLCFSINDVLCTKHAQGRYWHLARDLVLIFSNSTKASSVAPSNSTKARGDLVLTFCINSTTA